MKGRRAVFSGSYIRMNDEESKFFKDNVVCAYIVFLY